jgi:AbrB family looped-hinge helix DNA binding protein
MISYLSNMKTRVSERGQVTIPKRLRDRLGIRPGQLLEVREEGGRLLFTKVNPRGPVDAVYGVIDLPGSTDETLRALRGDRDDLL